MARHHAVVRRELRRHHGREMDTAGDGFFATFDQPADAIQCAVAVAERLRPLGIEIRAGVQIGQVEVAAPKVQGIAVNIGARVAAKAAPGQVLVSSTVRDALAGSDIRFVDEGVSELKGVPGEWRLFVVQRDERLLSQSVGAAERPLREAPEVDGALIPLYRRPVPLAIAGAVVVGARHWRPPARPWRRSLVRAGSRHRGTHRPFRELHRGWGPGGKEPTGIAAGNGALWVTNFVDRTLQPIDPSTGQAGPAVGLSGTPTGIAVGGCCVWITNSFEGQLIRYDIRTNSQKEIPTGGGPAGVTYEGGFLWVTDKTRDQVLRIDTQSREIRRVHLGVGSAPNGIAVGGGRSGSRRA